MRTYHQWHTRREPYERQRAAGRYNPALEIFAPFFFLGRSPSDGVTLSAGTSDTLDVFRERELLIVIASNDALGYVGAQVFTADGAELASVFVDDSKRAEYLLKLSPVYRAKRLLDWLDV